MDHLNWTEDNNYTTDAPQWPLLTSNPAQIPPPQLTDCLFRFLTRLFMRKLNDPACHPSTCDVLAPDLRRLSEIYSLLRFTFPGLCTLVTSIKRLSSLRAAVFFDVTMAVVDGGSDRGH